MIYFIALICFLLPSYLIRFSIFGIPTTLLEVLIYIAIIITIVAQIRNPKFEIRNPSTPLRIGKSQFSLPRGKAGNNQFPKLIIPMILFLLAGIISVFIAPDKKEALGLFKAYIFDPILFFFIIYIEFTKKEKSEIRISKFETILKALILSGALVAIQAIYQKLTGQLTLDGRVVGIFGYSPNYLALYLAPIAVLTFGYSLLASGEKNDAKTYIVNRTWLYDLALLVMIWAILLSGSRAAIGAVIIGAVSYFVIKYWSFIKSKKIFVLLFFCSLVLLVITGWFMVKPDWQLSSLEGGRITSSNNIRWEIWKTTAKDIIPVDRNWLLGVGIGNYQNYFTELTQGRVNYSEWIAPMALTPHNLFLTVWVNLGLLGLIAFIWFLYLFFSYMLHVTCCKNKLTSFSLILIAVMITILIQGLVDSPYWKNDLAVMFLLILALELYIIRTQKE